MNSVLDDVDCLGLIAASCDDMATDPNLTAEEKDEIETRAFRLRQWQLTAMDVEREIQLGKPEPSSVTESQLGVRIERADRLKWRVRRGLLIAFGLWLILVVWAVAAVFGIRGK